MPGITSSNLLQTFPNKSCTCQDLFSLWYVGHNACATGDHSFGPLRLVKPSFDFDQDAGRKYDNNQVYFSKAKFVMEALANAAVQSKAVTTAAVLQSLAIADIQSVAHAAISWWVS